jgi:biotin operon repressor
MILQSKSKLVESQAADPALHEHCLLETKVLRARIAILENHLREHGVDIRSGTNYGYVLPAPYCLLVADDEKTPSEMLTQSSIRLAIAASRATASRFRPFIDAQYSHSSLDEASRDVQRR